MSRRSFSREFKLEAVRLVRERGLTVARQLEISIFTRTCCKWVKQYREDPAHAFPGAGQMKPEQAEIAQLKKEIRKLKPKRDNLKKPRPTSQRTRREIRVHCNVSRDLDGDMDARGARCLAERVIQLAIKTAERSNDVRRDPAPGYPSELL